MTAVTALAFCGWAEQRMNKTGVKVTWKATSLTQFGGQGGDKSQNGRPGPHQPPRRRQCTGGSTHGGPSGRPH